MCVWKIDKINDTGKWIAVKNSEQKFAVPGWVYVIITVLFGIVLVALRTVELDFYTNFNTGFYNGPDWLPTVFFSLTALFFVVLLVLTMADRNSYQADFHRRGKRPIQIASAVVCVFAVLYFGMTFIQSARSLQSDPAGVLLNGLFGILMVAGFVYLPVRIGKSEGGVADILLCFPCLWACSQLFFMFLDHMMVATIYENLLNILRVAALCLFFFGMARVCAGMEQRNTRRWMVLFGLTTVLLGLCTTVSQYIVALPALFSSGSMEPIYRNDHIMAATPLDFIITVFVFVFVISYLSSCKSKEGPVNDSGEDVV